LTNVTKSAASFYGGNQKEEDFLFVFWNGLPPILMRRNSGFLPKDSAALVLSSTWKQPVRIL
jgi:hypothetical protein